MKSNFILSKY